VVKNLTRVNGGSVGVESVDGKGSRFFVTLPSGGGDSVITHHTIADREKEIS
jgi:signal transduction histidine kinase